MIRSTVCLVSMALLRSSSAQAPSTAAPAFNETALTEDWIGALVNECMDVCSYEWCDAGEWCTATTCTNPCTNDVTCNQEFLGADGEWKSLDCTNGVQTVVETCEPYCEYEDCSQEVNGDVCWRELCDDGCGGGNCTLWLKDENDQWLGDYCDDHQKGNFLADTDMQQILMRMQATGKAYEDSIRQVFDTLCPDQNCKDQQHDIIDLLNGNLPNNDPLKDQNITTAELSQNLTGMAEQQLAESGLLAMGQNVMNQVVNQTDMVFQNQMIKEIVGSLMNDTEKATGVNLPNEMWQNTNNTMDGYQRATEVWSGDVTAAVDQWGTQIPANQPQLSQMLGVFKQGLASVGLYRKGQRDNN